MSSLPIPSSSFEDIESHLADRGIEALVYHELSPIIERLIQLGAVASPEGLNIFTAVSDELSDRDRQRLKTPALLARDLMTQLDDPGPRTENRISLMLIGLDNAQLVTATIALLNKMSWKPKQHKTRDQAIQLCEWSLNLLSELQVFIDKRAKSLSSADETETTHPTKPNLP